MRPRWIMLVAGALLLGPAGCTGPADRVDGPPPAGRSSQSVSPDERAEGLAAQRRLLADRVASRDDYETSVGGLQRCLAAHGIALVNKGWNPVDQLSMMIWYRATDKPDEYVTGYGDSCFEAYLSAVDDEYRKTAAPTMEPRLLTSARACLVTHGITPRGGEKSMADLLALSEESEPVTTCVKQGVSQLYPGIPVPLGW
ncbi:hypothetical protein [Actinoplanes sp. NPDC049599]|uniref:hypothetical protein n=1 Tax=Actinoplanes sp. NPDC049599 TaxID=3363903 RepID=UPI0037BAC6B3